MTHTGLVFYRPCVPTYRLHWHEAAYVYLSGLVKGKTPVYTHVALYVYFPDEDATWYWHLTWDGVEAFNSETLDKNYDTVRLPVKFSTTHLDLTSLVLSRAGYKLLVTDLLRSACGLRRHQWLCTDYVQHVLDVKYDHRRQQALTPDELFVKTIQSAYHIPKHHD